MVVKKRVSIDPERISLLEENPGTDRAGILKGKVVQLMADGNRVRMVVNAGVMITVLLKLQSYHHRAPAIGDQVFLQVAADAVH